MTPEWSFCSFWFKHRPILFIFYLNDTIHPSRSKLRGILVSFR